MFEFRWRLLSEVAQRRQQQARRLTVIQRGGAGLLAQLDAIGIVDQRQMQVFRVTEAEALLQINVQAGVFQQVCATYHLVHSLQFVVDDLLSDLPETHRRIVKLRIEGYRAEDISQAAQRSKRTVERVLKEFRQKLSALIDARPGQPNQTQSTSSLKPR